MFGLCLLAIFFDSSFLFCSKPKSKIETLSRVALPRWVKRYSLYFPHSKVIGQKKKFLLKTTKSLDFLQSFYHKTLSVHDFKLDFTINKKNRILLQFRKGYEVISIELSKLPFSENQLIRLGYSEVKSKTN